jgi:hypothetical protein
MSQMLTNMRTLSVPDRWCVHSYYTLCPYAPDGSGRLLLAGADLDQSVGEVLILNEKGGVIDRFGSGPIQTAFFHTGRWQTWSPDAVYVYYQSGSLQSPSITRREISTGKEVTIEGDMEGAPPDGEPLLSGLMGMLYAAGYGSGQYQPEMSPVPFQLREDHGLFETRFDPPERCLRLSVADVLARHPHRDAIHKADLEVKDRLGSDDGLTLMVYCVRWSPDGERFLFYFGNHNVVKRRGEPRLSYVFTADRALEDIHLAIDLSFGRPGVHWSWHPDGVHLIGYGPDPYEPGELCLAQVAYDGSDYRRLSQHASGGHPSVSPLDHHLVVTDDTHSNPGEVLFIDTKRDRFIQTYRLSRVYGDQEPPGRNPYRVCHHPVFDREGRRVLVNTLSERDAVTCEIDVPGGTM